VQIRRAQPDAPFGAKWHSICREVDRQMFSKDRYFTFTSDRTHSNRNKSAVQCGKRVEL
jgi:hypothetical protein